MGLSPSVHFFGGPMRGNRLPRGRVFSDGPHRPAGAELVSLGLVFSQLTLGDVSFTRRTFVQSERIPEQWQHAMPMPRHGIVFFPMSWIAAACLGHSGHKT